MKKERKEWVKSQRKKFKEDPKGFFVEFYLEPTKRFWKKNPLKAFLFLLKWILIYYLIFGFIYAVNYDMVYCDSSIDEYDGKVMYVYNDFVQYYNLELLKLKETFNPQNMWEQADIVNNFNQKYSMYCTYDLNRWRKESFLDKIKTIMYSYKKVLLKKS